ncbi:MAG: pyridoxamine 5'-phosphate oxidase family protein [Candidatus Saccharimonadales bacterium]
MDETDPNYSKIMAYIDRNPAAVLSTINDDGTPYGAVVYVCSASHRTVCFVTKRRTQKYKDIDQRPIVSLTFFNEKEGSTLQTTGAATITNDHQMIDYVMDKIAKSHVMQAGWQAPVTKLEGSDYLVVGVKLDTVRLTEFQGAGISSEPTITELGVNHG